MKVARQRILRQLLEEDEPRTQRELMAALASEGFEVTQATVSRDLADLGAIKTRNLSGRSAYSLGADIQKGGRSIDALKRRLAGSLQSVDASGDLVVVKTLPGHAQFVASAIDDIAVREVVGTVGGDDTILVVSRPGKGRKVKDVLRSLGEMGVSGD
ncbi:MAG: arginine repressor [Acidobacteria bacterium]|nr:MAG: arginine repressor [Acidobacteriota bacterium]